MARTRGGGAGDYGGGNDQDPTVNRDPGGKVTVDTGGGPTPITPGGIKPEPKPGPDPAPVTSGNVNGVPGGLGGMGGYGFTNLQQYLAANPSKQGANAAYASYGGQFGTGSGAAFQNVGGGVYGYTPGGGYSLGMSTLDTALNGYYGRQGQDNRAGPVQDQGGGPAPTPQKPPQTFLGPPTHTPPGAPPSGIAPMATPGQLPPPPMPPSPMPQAAAQPPMAGDTGTTDRMDRYRGAGGGGTFHNLRTFYGA